MFATFFIGKPGWHIGASGVIYGLAFFLFFSGLLRKHVPLIALSLLITFLYGGLWWNMIPHFAKASTSWEGHLSGAIAGTLCAIGFMRWGPQRPEPFADDEEELSESDTTYYKESEKNDSEVQNQEATNSAVSTTECKEKQDSTNNTFC